MVWFGSPSPNSLTRMAPSVEIEIGEWKKLGTYSVSSSFSSIELRRSDSASSIVATLFMASRRALRGTSIVEASRLMRLENYTFLQLVRVKSVLSQIKTEGLQVNAACSRTLDTRGGYLREALTS